jgi:hypothetical protein
MGSVHQKINTITWRDLINDDLHFRSRMDIVIGTGLILNEVDYNNLNNAYQISKKTFYIKNDMTVDLADFFRDLKKGSKKMRVVQSKSKISTDTGTGTIVKKINCPLKHFSVIGEEVILDRDCAALVNSRWNKNYYSSDLRCFLFKLYHNTLGLNIRVHHINPERDESCTFCSKAKNLPAERESFVHLFWYCPLVSGVLIQFLNRHITFEVTKRNYLFGLLSDNKFSEPLAVVFDILKYVFWQLKLRGRLPNRHNVECEFNYLLGILLNSNKKLKGQINSCNLFRRHGEE